MENFTEIFRFEKFFIYLKEERQKDKIIVADRRRELVFLKNDQFLLWIHLRCSLHVTQLILTTRYVPGRLRISMQIHWAGVFGSKILVASPPAPSPACRSRKLYRLSPRSFNSSSLPPKINRASFTAL